MIRKAALGLAAVSLAASSIAVSAAPPAEAQTSAARKLAIGSSAASVQRAATPVTKARKLGDDSNLIYYAIGAIALGVGIFFLVDGDDSPSSP